MAEEVHVELDLPALRHASEAPGLSSATARQLAESLGAHPSASGLVSEDDLDGGLVHARWDDGSRSTVPAGWLKFAGRSGRECISLTHQETYVGTEDDGIVSPPIPAPLVPLLLEQEASGVRLTMGSADGECTAMTCPNIYIERQAGSWLILIHDDGGDPVACRRMYDSMPSIAEPV